MSVNCNSCQARVMWIKTAATGKPMPLDAEPNPNGSIVIRDGLAHVLKTGALLVPGERRFTSHFATCPNAAGHRKRRPPPAKP